MPFTSAYLQELVDQQGLIFLMDGEYHIDKTVMLGDNTTLIMSPRARIYRQAKVPVFGTRPGSKNITVRGGTVIGQGPKLSDTAYGNLTYIFKAKNVTFEDMILQDILGSHGVEINASKDVSLLNCKFYGYKLNPDAVYREAVQIDFACHETLPEFPVGSPYYDLECCDGVKIIGCVFDKSDRYPAPLNAIGTHTQPNSKNKSKNIIISKNIAKGIGGNGSYGIFVHAINFKNVEITDNIVENYARFVRIFNNAKEYKADGSYISNGKNSYCEQIRIANNIVAVCEFFKSVGVYAISNNGTPHRDIQVEHNTFISDNLTTMNHFLTDFNDCKRIKVVDNTNNAVFTTANPIKFTNCVDYIDRNNDFFVKD